MAGRIRYTGQLIQEALARVLHEPVIKVAKELGVKPSTIYTWRSHVKAGKIKLNVPNPTPTPNTDAVHKTTVTFVTPELAALREENDLLKRMVKHLIKSA